MDKIDTEQILTKIGELKIDDRNVNKMRRNRSARIQQQQERKQSLSLSFSLDLCNNNWLVIDEQTNKEDGVIEKNTEPDQNANDEPVKKEEFILEHENIHFQRAKKLFTYITRNEYVIRCKKSVEDDSDDCGCVLTKAQVKRGERGCGTDCLNHQMSIECNKDCKLGPLCGNQRIQNFENAKCTIFITEKKGYGLFASTIIPAGTFIMEFVGEVVSMAEFKKRSREYAKNKTRHCYVMTSSGNRLIDATKKGNLMRFVNHSCDPNAETQKWTVNGECRIGVFSKKMIKTFEEITINYQFERFG